MRPGRFGIGSFVHTYRLCETDTSRVDARTSACVRSFSMKKIENEIWVFQLLARAV